MLRLADLIQSQINQNGFKYCGLCKKIDQTFFITSPLCSKHTSTHHYTKHHYTNLRLIRKLLLFRIGKTYDFVVLIHLFLCQIQYYAKTHLNLMHLQRLILRKWRFNYYYRIKLLPKNSLFSKYISDVKFILSQSLYTKSQQRYKTFIVRHSMYLSQK